VKSSTGYVEALQQTSCIAGRVHFFSKKDCSICSSPQCGYDDLKNLHSTAARCHDKTASHMTAFVAHSTFGQTRINVLLDNQRSTILGFEQQPRKKHFDYISWS